MLICKTLKMNMEYVQYLDSMESTFLLDFHDEKGMENEETFINMKCIKENPNWAQLLSSFTRHGTMFKMKGKLA